MPKYVGRRAGRTWPGNLREKKGRDILDTKACVAIPVSSVVWREDLYPRIKTSHSTVNKYAEDLTVLPPVEVNQHNELIDGWHRWTAHKQAGAETIQVTVTQTVSDTHLLELAIERNAAFGLQLSQEDKKSMARRLYHMTPAKRPFTIKKSKKLLRNT